MLLRRPLLFSFPLLFAAAFAQVACGVGQPAPAPPVVLVDGGVVVEDGGVEPLLEIGTGAAAFEPLEDGQTVPIIAGPQGGYHIWTAIRIRAPLVPKALTLQLRVEKDGVALEPTDFQVNLIRNGAYHERWALTAMVPDPAAIAGQEVLLAVDVIDSNGLKAGDARRVIAQAP